MRLVLICFLLLSKTLLVKANESAELFSPTVIPSCNMSGVYSIGSSGDFISITAAMDSLKARGIAGDIIFELAVNYSSSGEVYPLNFPKDDEIPCFNNNRITIRPSAAAGNLVIGGSRREPLLEIKLVNYLIIDGRPGGAGSVGHLKIHNESLAPVIRLVQSSNNKFLYLDFTGGADSTSGYPGLVHVVTNSNDNKFQSCNFYSGATNRRNLVYAYGDAGSFNTNDSLIDCNFHDFYTNAITLEEENRTWKIQSSSFYCTNTNPFPVDATFIKISSNFLLDTTYSYNISNNYFGGSQPHCQGNAMTINYQTTFYMLDVRAGAIVDNNHFARLNFTQTAYTGASVGIRLISINEGLNSYYHYSISNNHFGSADAVDSIHFSHDFSYTILVYGIYVDQTAIARIDHNEFNEIHCNAPGGIDMTMIWTESGGEVNDNLIGNSSVYNSISNYSNSSTRGIFSYCGRMFRNSVSHIVGLSNGGAAGVGGIMIAANIAVDSICYNKVFQLRCGAIDNPGMASLLGISFGATNISGADNIVSDNIVYALENYSSNSAGNLYGISLYSALKVQRNLVHSLKSTSVATVNIYGIYNGNLQGYMENNMVSLGFDSLGNSITAGNIFLMGIYGGTDVKHNSVYIGGDNVASGFNTSVCYYFPSMNTETRCYNNIFYNARSNASPAATAKHQCVNAAVLTGSQINYNLYYATGNGGVIGFNSSTYCTTLAQWKTVTGKDVNSIFGDPLFVGRSAGADFIDLHLTEGSPADGAGIAGYSLINDFDKELRSGLTRVDIGADAGNYANSIIFCPDGDGTFMSDISGLNYQWQVNTGTGYTNLTTNAYYSGVNTNTLQFTSIPSSFYGYYYRCIVDGNTSTEKMLKIKVTWTGAVNNLWSEPGNWGCLQVPDGNTDVFINNGAVLVDMNGFCRSLTIGPGVTFNVGSGYDLTITH